MTGIHRDTIMRLGVRVGEACTKIMDERMVNLNCNAVEVDELWGFIGKKKRNTNAADKREGLGDVWTFMSICADSKLIPSFVVGKRDKYHACMFMEDLGQASQGTVCNFPVMP